jgi:hypothetical protein
MTEKEIRDRLDKAIPAETPLCCLYLVAAVFESPAPGVTWGPVPRYNMAPLPKGDKPK